MLWQGRRESSNVEDRRGVGGPMIAGGGIITLVIALIVWLMGGDPRQVMQQAPSGSGTDVRDARQAGAQSGERDEMSRFVSVVLADTEDVWSKLFQQQMGKRYREPKLVLFSGRVQSTCGLASSATGPFYCPGDEQVYIDLSFYRELKERFRAPGDFAQAYVIAHEVGHHVQKLMGITDQVDSMRQRVSKAEYNRLSVRLELQADFFAGVWAHHAQKTKHVLEPGDVEEALRAAAAIGDDRLQRQAQGYVVPDSFTHGTSEQRVRWFRKGFETGDVRQGDTFKVPDGQL
jgi:predicted metalloprotease